MTEQTERRFAWTVEPKMTPMLMGAGYGSAAVFWARVIAGRRWHTVGLGFLPTTVFTWMLLAATLLHWDKFHHGTGVFRLSRPSPPLTVAAFVALPGVAWLVIATEGRSSATKVGCRDPGAGLVLLLVAVTRGWAEFDTGRPLAWPYVGGMVGTLAALSVWWDWMERHSSELSSAQPDT